MTPDTLELCLDKRNGSEFFDEIIVGRFTRISFHRTLRIPEDGRDYPLPAGLGRFPIHRVEDYANKVPVKWLEEGGFFIPLYQREALYLQFEGPEWHPSIAKICVGNINAITGTTNSHAISNHNQDYILIPQQKWLDGINAGDGIVRQFVAMPLGSGYSIEAQMTDEETHGGFQFLVIQAKLGRFPDQNPIWNDILNKIERVRKAKQYQISVVEAASIALNTAEKSLYFKLLFKITGRQNISEPGLQFQRVDGQEHNFLKDDADMSMAIAAGGTIRQDIFADTYGAETWDPAVVKPVRIHMVNSLAYESITGEPPPPSPISREDYKYQKIPWYAAYEETYPRVKPASLFRRILGVSSIDRRRGIRSECSDEPMEIPPEIINRIRTPDANESSTTFRRRAHESARRRAWLSARSEISHAIDLGVDVKSSDYALRCCCNYHLQCYTDGEVDGSLALVMNPSSKDARSWRAYCRLATGNHEGLREDADVLSGIPETASLGREMQVETAMLSGRYDDAVNIVMNIMKLEPSHPLAKKLVTRIFDAQAQTIRNRS